MFYSLLVKDIETGLFSKFEPLIINLFTLNSFSVRINGFLEKFLVIISYVLLSTGSITKTNNSFSLNFMYLKIGMLSIKILFFQTLIP